MTHYRTLRDSDWLGQWDLPAGRDVTVEIESVSRYKPAVARMRKMPDGSKRPEAVKRLDVGFKGKRKHWLAGPVSQETIVGMFGPEIESWIGQKIALYVDPDVTMGRKRVGGVRVRPSAARGPATEDPLDQPVDEERAALIDEAREGT